MIQGPFPFLPLLELDETVARRLLWNGASYFEAP